MLGVSYNIKLEADHRGSFSGYKAQTAPSCPRRKGNFLKYSLDTKKKVLVANLD